MIRRERGLLDREGLSLCGLLRSRLTSMSISILLILRGWDIRRRTVVLRIVRRGDSYPSIAPLPFIPPTTSLTVFKLLAGRMINYALSAFILFSDMEG